MARRRGYRSIVQLVGRDDSALPQRHCERFVTLVVVLQEKGSRAQPVGFRASSTTLRRTGKNKYIRRSIMAFDPTLNLTSGRRPDESDALVKPARYVHWEPQPGPQEMLLTCSLEDIAFGGARGGGKTAGMLGDFLFYESQYGKHAQG